MQKIPSQLVKTLNDKKIFCIPSHNQQWMSYFIIRSWGNYLFFPHPDVSNMYPFIKGQGGIYKVFDEAVPFPFYNAEIFTIFGASTIGSSLRFHPDFQVESYGEEYFDADLRIDQGVFKLWHQKEEYTFFDFNRPEEQFSPIEFSRLAMIQHPDP